MENEIGTTISELPDELLLEMLSWLPSQDVVATSFLSKRWCSLWKELKTFRYDGECVGPTYWRFVLFIRKTSKVETLELKLNPHSTNIINIKTLVNDAVARSLRKLRIEVVYSSLELPESLYLYSQLETLILEKQSLVDVPPNVSLSGLKSLHLLSVRFSCDESVKTLLSICPRLEDLVLRRSSYTNVMIFPIDVPTLKSLSIKNTSGKYPPKGTVHGFVINAPSLRCFSIRDSFSNYLRFRNMPKLVKASVNIVCDQPENNILGSLASSKYLYLCSLTQYLPPATSFLFLHHLELYLCPSEGWSFLTRLLKDAPRLRVLKIKLYQKHCVQFNNAATVSWNQPNCVPECLISHLEIFEWRQYNGTEQEREAAKYILANASRLKNATFYSKSAEKHEMLKELECVARGSKTCMLSVINNL